MSVLRNTLYLTILIMANFINGLHAQAINEAILPIPQTIKLETLKVSLGKLLFNDIRLSSMDNMACASCHRLELGGDDGLSRSITNTGTPDLSNAPTVFNSKYNFRFTWRGEFRTLEQQARASLTNPRHSNIKLDDLINKLKPDKNYERLFKMAYNTGLNQKNLLNAIAEYQRSLITPDARFDLYLRGDKTAITKNEKAGYDLFKLYGCVSCHQGINIGGNMFQKFGIMQNYFTRVNKITSADLGRFQITKVQDDKHVFKVPSLRNVEVTAPYFHDGSASSLTQAVKIMAQYQLGVNIPIEDVDKITGFLKTLTGKYNGKYLNKINNE